MTRALYSSAFFTVVSAVCWATDRIVADWVAMYPSVWSFRRQGACLRLEFVDPLREPLQLARAASDEGVDLSLVVSASETLALLEAHRLQV